jgi:large subunit ribosomal protein L22
MAATKTNERPGTRATLRYCRMSAYKAREVLDLIRGKDVAQAGAILRFSEREAARIVGKLLASAVANAENNDGQSADELYVSACYADEAPTVKRWRPRARGRATRIRKRTCHITLVVSRLPEEELHRLQARAQAEAASRRARRVAGGRRGLPGRRRRERPAELETTAEETGVAEPAGAPEEPVVAYGGVGQAPAASENEEVEGE